MIALFYHVSLMCCPIREPRSGDVIPEVTIVAKKKKKKARRTAFRVHRGVFAQVYLMAN